MFSDLSQHAMVLAMVIQYLWTPGWGGQWKGTGKLWCAWHYHTSLTLYFLNLISSLKPVWFCVWWLSSFFRMQRITDQDFRCVEEFVTVMRVLYTSALCASSERAPACCQILPILQKLESHFKVQDADSTFTAAKGVEWPFKALHSMHFVVVIVVKQYIMKGSNFGTGILFISHRIKTLGCLEEDV